MTEQKRTAQQALADLGAIQDPAQRSAATDAWLRKIEPVLTSMAARICVDRGINRTHYGDDVHQVVSLEVTALIEEVHKKPSLAQEIGNFSGFLESRARKAVTVFMNSPEGYNHLAEMTGWGRRRAELERVREELRAALNREPADQEIVDEANSQFQERRSNPTKQGMVFNLEDLQMRGQPEDIELHGSHASVVERNEESPVELHSTERIELVLLTIKACEKESILLGKVARVYLEPALDHSYDEEPSAAHIARVLNIKQSTARSNRIRVRAVARRVLLSKWGITGVNESINLAELMESEYETSAPSATS